MKEADSFPVDELARAAGHVVRVREPRVARLHPHHARVRAQGRMGANHPSGRICRAGSTPACAPSTNGRAFEIEYRLRRRDGAYRWVRDRAVPRYSQEGAFIGFSGHVSCATDFESNTGGLR